MELSEVLKRAEVTNQVNDPELDEMIYRLDYTPADELNIDIQDQMHIYNWLRELELYHKLCGPLDKV
jgi:hypothetical protein